MRRRSRSPAPDADGSSSDIVSSQLLPKLFEQIADRERLQVLDLGSGNQSTLNFFVGRNAAIHFVDLFSCDLVVDQPEELSAAEACEYLLQYLRLSDDLVFDVCLIWDALHYLPPSALQGLSRALAPHLIRGSLGYGFGSRHSGARTEQPVSAGYRYGIEDESHLKLSRVQREGRYHAHTQQQLDEFFPALSIQKATLLQEGRLEFLFARN